MGNKVNAYMRLARLDKPVGIWLLFWPCAWSITLAAGWASLHFLALFGAGAIVMRSAGCIINDIADREFDKQVERTRTRPLASGEVSLRGAIIELGLLLLIALFIVMQLPLLVFQLALCALPLVALYPFMKRITWWPQAFLGLTFNFGALMGWAAIHNNLAVEAWLLYAAGFFWTLGYDTIYGHQDKEDDKQIGVKSTSLKLGERTKPFVLFCYLATLALMVGAGANPLFLLPAALHLAWQLRITHIDQPASCARAFRANQWTGLLLWFALFATATNILPAF